VCYAAGMTKFLYAIGVRIFDYPQFASTLRDRVRERAAPPPCRPPLSGREARRHAVRSLRNPAGRKRDIAIPQP
jgi:hypothetical protein